MSSVGVTAETFLEAMFADALPSTHTMLTAFVGDPSTADRAAWAGRPWRPGERVPSWYRAANAYLTVSTFEPDPDTGELRRRKANFAQLHAVMVDDLGTKIPLGVVRLPFSALVETSPRNWQGWYFLRDDADAHDRVKAETLIARMVAAGLTKDGKDPGMKGVTRYGRLPIGVNAKAAYVEQLGRPWPVACREFSPDWRYSVAEIASAFGLDMTLPPPRPARAVTTDEMQASEMRFDVLLEVLRAIGLYKQPIGNGWHEITCPWIDTHTMRADSGAAIREPSEANAWRGGFCCHHGHCEKRGMRHVREFLRNLAVELERGAA